MPNRKSAVSNLYRRDVTLLRYEKAIRAYYRGKWYFAEFKSEYDCFRPMLTLEGETRTSRFRLADYRHPWKQEKRELTERDIWRQ